ncbi:hypothetical protein ACIBQX_11815 [Nonomuraea sp. NPDC049714]|uniref:hypothetical protein n=1 Tax=Nonomuraea sp. NPDC049714 TaxID=3364357 RepID=UPI0037B3F824
MPHPRDTDPAARARLHNVMEKRRVHLRLTWNQVAKLAGLTKEGLRSVRTETRRMMPLTKRGIETALQWEPGSVDLVLEDRPPIDAHENRTRDSLSGAAGSDETTPGVQRWFLAELRRRKLSLTDLAASIEALREIGVHHGQTLAELLIESGLADRDELEVRDLPQATKNAITRFHSELEGITSSPRLSARQRRKLEESAAEGLQEIRKESREDR